MGKLPKEIISIRKENMISEGFNESLFEYPYIINEGTETETRIVSNSWLTKVNGTSNEIIDDSNDKEYENISDDKYYENTVSSLYTKDEYVITTINGVDITHSLIREYNKNEDNLNYNKVSAVDTYMNNIFSSPSKTRKI